MVLWNYYYVLYLVFVKVTRKTTIQISEWVEKNWTSNNCPYDSDAEDKK